MLFKIQIVEIFLLQSIMPGMQSAEYQMTVPLKFLIIIHNYASVWTINHSKSLSSFRVVMSLDVAEGQIKMTQSDRLKFRLGFVIFLLWNIFLSWYRFESEF